WHRRARRRFAAVRSRRVRRSAVRARRRSRSRLSVSRSSRDRLLNRTAERALFSLTAEKSLCYGGHRNDTRFPGGASSWRRNMRRLVLTLSALMAVGVYQRCAFAQDQEENPTPPGEEKPAAQPATPGPTTPAAPEEKGAAAGTKQWQDIIVVPRKAVLKTGR